MNYATSKRSRFITFVQAATKFSTKAASALPGAVSNIKNEVQELSLNDKTKLANEILLLISRSDINLNKEEALLIADEISEHPTELKNIISQLSEAFSKN